MEKTLITITDDKKQEIKAIVKKVLMVAIPLLIVATTIWAVGGVKASNTALLYANQNRSDVSYVRFELDLDDFIPTYDVSWYEGRTEYEYTVHAFTGDIMGFERD